MGTKRVQYERGSFLACFIKTVGPVQTILVLVLVLVSPVQNIIFLTAHFFTLSVPFAEQPGQAGVLGRLSLVSTKCFNSIAQNFIFFFFAHKQILVKVSFYSNLSKNIVQALKKLNMKYCYVLHVFFNIFFSGGFVWRRGEWATGSLFGTCYWATFHMCSWVSYVYVY